MIFLSPLAMDFFENEGIGLKMLVCAGSSQLLSQLGRALDRNLGSEVEKRLK